MFDRIRLVIESSETFDDMFHDLSTFLSGALGNKEVAHDAVAFKILRNAFDSYMKITFFVLPICLSAILGILAIAIYLFMPTTFGADNIAYMFLFVLGLATFGLFLKPKVILDFMRAHADKVMRDIEAGNRSNHMYKGMSTQDIEAHERLLRIQQAFEDADMLVERDHHETSTAVPLKCNIEFGYDVNLRGEERFRK